MANLTYQDKIICQFLGKLIRQSTTNPRTNISLQYVTWGGQFTCRLSNNITFFHCDLKE